MTELDDLARAIGIPERSALAPADLRILAESETSLAAFIRHAWHVVEPKFDYVPNWHIEAMAAHLEAVGDGKIDNLLLNVPPGCLKSILLCVMWPAWEWGPRNRPATRFMFGAYDQKLATRDSIRCRDLIKSEWYQRLWGDRYSIVRTQDARTLFANTATGWRLSINVGGRGTGEHPDIIAIDDATSTKRGVSQADLQTANDWWDATIGTRGIARKSRRVVSGQRLDVNDISAHVKARAGESWATEWDHITLAMRHEPGLMERPTSLGWIDPRTRSGELLFPKLFPESAVAKMERVLGPHRAAGQLGQRPHPPGGNLFQRTWFPVVREFPRGGRMVRYYDRGATESGGDWTVGVLMTLVDGRFYIPDVVRVQYEPGKRNKLIKATARRDRRNYGDVETWCELEGGSTGKESGHLLVRQLVGYQCYLDRPTGSKEVRANNWAGQAEAGNIILVEGEWVETWLDEICSFPQGSHDDQVDATSGAFSRLALTDDGDAGDIVASGGDDSEHDPLTVAELRRQSRRGDDQGEFPGGDGLDAFDRELLSILDGLDEDEPRRRRR